MVLYLCVLIVFSLHRESLKLILVDEPLHEVVLSHSPPAGTLFIEGSRLMSWGTLHRGSRIKKIVKKETYS
jgi:hypothetical protein